MSLMELTAGDGLATVPKSKMGSQLTIFPNHKTLADAILLLLQINHATAVYLLMFRSSNYNLNVLIRVT